MGSEGMSWLYHRNISFNRQLSTTFIFGILILSLISSSLISFVVTQAAVDRFVNQGIHLTDSFAAQSRLALLYGAAENAQLPANTMLDFPDVKHVSIFYPDYKLLLAQGAESAADLGNWTHGLTFNAQLVKDLSDYWYFAAKVSSSSSEENVESPYDETRASVQTLGYVLVAVSKASLQEMTQKILFVNALIAVSLASVLLIVLRFITRKLTTPLENLSGIMQRAENGETQIRAKLEGPKDIVDMEQAFNSMMSVLEERESELKDARDQALETARAKTEFAAVVSHEIRTPLNGVLGMLNLLNEIGVPDRQSEYLNVAINSGDALLALINDILDFSKIEAGKLELEVVKFNLRECLEDVAALFSEKAQAKNIEICLDIPSDLPVIVAGDITRLRQILNNLLSNAVKFTDQGEVVLSSSVYTDDGDNSWFNFLVRDTGIGIPKEAQNKIFESFRQADGGTTRKFGGTGLGLTICKQLIQLLGGELLVESVEGEGSVFSFAIPISITKKYQVNPCFSGVQVIVADTNQTNRNYLVANLRSFGCSCIAGGSETEIMNQLKKWPESQQERICIFDLSVCVSGVNRFRQDICSWGKNSKTIMVILSNSGFLEGDCQDYDATLTKPVRLSALNARIAQFTEGLWETEKGVDKRVKKPLVSDNLGAYILIVDDNRTNQLVAKAMLKESGFQADVAANGQEALFLIADKNYDLILMDCNMPVMDGYEATRKIRSLNGDMSKIPIFAMTAVDNPNDIRRCLDVGMNDYLIKPLNLAILRKKLKDLPVGNPGQFRVSNSQKTSRIDTESFQNLENAIGNKVGEIIDAFFADTPNYIDQIDNALNKQDWSQLHATAHSLKGSSRNLGANMFASICREIEELSQEEDISDSQISQRIVDLREEYIQVERCLNEKSTSLKSSRSQIESGKYELVLVVDDDRSTRLTIASALQADGLTIEQATNGQQAIDKFIQFSPNLIIMDAVMPVKDGFEASQEIKRLPNGRLTPILIITALENDESVDRAFSSGAADFIPKPINLAVLRQRVKRVLDARETEERVKQLAYNDGLTGLPNRIAFSDRLLQDIAYARRNNNQLAIMFIDIDHFKDVNDNLGHAAGDELLKFLAERVSGCVRSEDTLARMGGDEFVVVLSSVHGPKGADIAAQNILLALSTPFHIAGKEIYVGASIGISVFPDDGEDREALLKNADTAMYRAKALGRNNYQFYTVEMSTSISERIDLESDLRRVIQNNELILYFQPKIDVRRSEVVGAEALVRWQHPKRGFLLPNCFIPIAEEAGLISQIGHWTMRMACQQFKIWQDENGFMGHVAVNVSAREFMGATFVDDVKACLEITGLEPQYLELEIIENLVLEHGEETVARLNQLSAMGVTVAIDDFGVGYSSFSYLKRLPVQVLKIDRSFVRDVPEDKPGSAVIDGMIQLAHKLKLSVVAEGVENQAQYEFLRLHDCDIVQGYFISKPVPSVDFYDKFVSQNHTTRAI